MVVDTLYDETVGADNPTAPTAGIDEDRIRSIIREEIRPLIDSVNALVELYRSPEEVFQRSALFGLRNIMRRRDISFEVPATLDELKKVSIFALYDGMVSVLKNKYGEPNPRHEGRSIVTDRYGKMSSKDIKAFMVSCGMKFTQVRDGERLSITYLVTM